LYGKLHFTHSSLSGSIQIKSDLGDLVLLGGRAGDIGIDQFSELWRAKRRLELQGSTEESLDESKYSLYICLNVLSPRPTIETKARWLFKKVVGILNRYMT
jgi:hypothetical protein